MLVIRRRLRCWPPSRRHNWRNPLKISLLTGSIGMVVDYHLPLDYHLQRLTRLEKFLLCQYHIMVLARWMGHFALRISVTAYRIGLLLIYILFALFPRSIHIWRRTLSFFGCLREPSTSIIFHSINPSINFSQMKFLGPLLYAEQHSSYKWKCRCWLMPIGD